MKITVMVALVRGGTFEWLHCPLLTPVTAKLITVFTMPGEFAQNHVPTIHKFSVFRVPDQCNMQNAVWLLRIN